MNCSKLFHSNLIKILSNQWLLSVKFFLSYWMKKKTHPFSRVWIGCVVSSTMSQCRSAKSPSDSYKVTAGVPSVSCRYLYSCLYDGSVVYAARPGRHWRDSRLFSPPQPPAKPSRAFSDTRTARTAHCTGPPYPRLRFSIRPSTVGSARTAFELFATTALPYKYGGQWRGAGAGLRRITILRRHKLKMQPMSSPSVLRLLYQLQPISKIWPLVYNHDYLIYHQ